MPRVKPSWKTNQRLRAPVKWFGGKGNMVAKIMPYLVVWPHTTYVEPFGGGASLLMAKLPAPVEVYNDLDEGLYNFFCVLADPKLFRLFRRRVEALPCSRKMCDECRREWAKQTDQIERVWRWFVVARQSFSGIFDAGWSSAVTATSRGMAETTSKWISTIGQLPEVHTRLQRVQIECADWRVILERYDTPDTLFYLDPPYVLGTRSGGNYGCEITTKDHRDLVSRLRGIEGAAVLSGYPTPMYGPLKRDGWEVKRFGTACHAAGKTRASGILGKGAALEMQARVECLWVHPKIIKQQKAVNHVRKPKRFTGGTRLL